MDEHEEVTPAGMGTRAEDVDGHAPAEDVGAEPVGAAGRLPRRRRGGGLKGMLDGVLKPAPPLSRADSEREAAEELQRATTPAMDRLVLAVPGAGTPEDALARIRQDLPAREVPSVPPPAEYLPDPEVAHTLALYRVRQHLESYRFPSAHEQELTARLRVGARSGPGNGGSN